jgi:hypothetical protein
MRASIALSTALLSLASLVGCAADTDSAAEEDAAAASSDGKMDGSSFALGPYINWSPEDGKPQLAYFHAPSAADPAGESGMVDYVSFDEEAYEAPYALGSFKVYQWRGRDRIRVTDADGKVLLRTDWSYADGALTIDGAELTQPRKLPEEMVDCLGVDIKEYWFEEGFTQWEYPDLSVDKEATGYSMNIGSWRLDSTEATITVKDTTSAFEASAALDGYTVSLKVDNKVPRRGQVVVKEGTDPETLVANVVCR